MQKYNIGIIGAGPGGYVAAIKAAQMGAKTALIEADQVGGVCLNRGCIPTKSIIASVNRLRDINESAALGITIEGEPKINLVSVISRKNRIVNQLVRGIGQLIKANKIELIKGSATLNEDRSISVDGNRIEATNIIIATGSTWRSIPGIERGGQNIVTSDDILDLTEVPRRPCILGGGVIGCEFASIFSALGSEVTIVEAMGEILPMEDKITSKTLARAFKKQGIGVLLNTTITGIQHRASSIELNLSNGCKLETDKLLISIGRKPSYDGLGIEKLGIKTENGAIITDEKLRTNVERIYAIGDVNGKYMLAHVASEEGIIAVENIMGRDTNISYGAVPRPVYTYPEICCVGPTERELTEKGIEFKTGRFGFAALPKAVCDGKTEGQAVVYTNKGKILGAQIVGDHATEIASELALAIRNGLTADDLSRTIHSHPTLSECIKEAVEDSEGYAIHKVHA